MKGNSALKKRAGTTQRGGRPAAGTPSSGRRTTARSVTTQGGGGTGGLPFGQQSKPGRQGQPPSGYSQPYSVEDGIAGETGGRA
ncbi:MAG TPA: hypothetical protein VMB05_07445 [Solirubrobacteraceae bacterium]|nr:hypothetical protein [Solirubrobacteraceae bacterium]HUB74488.1 hypothetical protein [Solirubrobacteraceae bacterium]